MSDLIARMEQRGFLTLGAAADSCGVSKATVSRWVERVPLDSVRIGQRLFVSRESLRGHLGEEAAEMLGV